MFSLYGVTGRVFKGTLEQLRREGPVSATARAQAVRALGPDASPERPATGRGPASPRAGRPDTISAYTAAGDVANERRPLSQVHELMSSAVLSAQQDASLAHAAQLMAQHQLSQLPVLDAQARLVGLLLRADLPQAWPEGEAACAQYLSRHAVLERMSTPVPTTESDADIRVVAALLIDTGLPGLPVVDAEGALVGMITRSDILRALVTEPPLAIWA